jgi:amino acid transporter
LLAWNLLGALDLIAALALGILSAPGSPLQLFGGTVGSAAVTVLPWSSIPALLVPFYLVTHALIFAHLSRPHRTAMA